MYKGDKWRGRREKQTAEGFRLGACFVKRSEYEIAP
jgi:hypothetical protein